MQILFLQRSHQWQTMILLCKLGAGVDVVRLDRSMFSFFPHPMFTSYLLRKLQRTPVQQAKQRQQARAADQTRQSAMKAKPLKQVASELAVWLLDQPEPDLRLIMQPGR